MSGRERTSPERAASNGVTALNGLGPARIATIQRARLIAAMVEVGAERGAGNVTVAHVVQRSGVSRRTFYATFEDRDACFLAAFEDAVACASERVMLAFSASGRWRERVRRALIAFLCFLDEEPSIGRLLIVESLAGDGSVIELRGRVLAQIVAAMDGACEEAGADTVAPLTGEGVLGGVLSVLHARMVGADHEPLLELTNPLMSLIVMPYLGSSAARRELARSLPAPADRGVSTTLLSDPFKDAGMRLTYRTVRVLMLIADSPRCSNRMVGEGAGINDQGQISKLLARLQRIGLISNTGLGPGQGAPNAWSLTPTGEQVTRSIRTHTNNSKTDSALGSAS